MSFGAKLSSAKIIEMALLKQTPARSMKEIRMARLMEMSVKDLRAGLDAANFDHSKCLDKRDLAELFDQARRRQNNIARLEVKVAAAAPGPAHDAATDELIAVLLNRPPFPKRENKLAVLEANVEKAEMLVQIEYDLIDAKKALAKKTFTKKPYY